ncbi:MAG: hypothetical protein CMP11_08925, partial [Zetaproteobacteria bacterium]|nr:hypothetical protein [Pseudobdellovibrionaceae bacterium]
MWRLIYLLILTSQLCLAEKKMTSVLNPDFDLSQLRGSIFKLQVSSQKLDYKRPWQGSSLRQSSGTGFYIGNNRILTNAHVVSNAKNIMIQRDRDDQLYHAYVEYIGHDCDLAIVVPVDTNILRGIQKLSFGELPKLNSPVATVGYPTGGEQLSVTKGVVSRVSNRFYVHSGFNSHVLIQIDSAINSGNSGGPVIQGSQVIGVAFQHLRAGENIGYVIPTPVIERFLKDTQNGSYDGHPLSGMKTLLWTTGSKAVQKYYSLKKSSGVQLAHLAWWAPGNQHLKPGDILLKVAGKTIGVDGKIDLFGERISFETIYDLKQEGETIDFEVSRNGQAKKVNFPITKAPAHPFGPYEHRRGSQYHILGGVVFTVLSLDWFATWGKNWSKSLPTFLKHLFY